VTSNTRDRADIQTEFVGGLWDCPGTPDEVGTGFLAGLDAARVKANAPKVTKKWLTTSLHPVDAGSVKTVTLKIRGLPVAVLRWRFTNIDASDAGPAGTVYEIADAEPRKNLRLSATPEGVDPLPFLKAMLKAGAGATPRAG
jgi:hypothetical protein